MREALLIRLGSLCADKPRRVIAGAVLLSALAAAALPSLEISSSRFDLIGGDRSFVQTDGARTDLVAVVRGDDPVRARAATEDLAGRLAALPQVLAVVHRLDPSIWQDRALLFLPVAELAALIRNAAAGSDLGSIVQRARLDLAPSPSETLEAMEADTGSDPLSDPSAVSRLVEVLEEAERWQNEPGRSQLVVPDVVPGRLHDAPVDSHGYFTSGDGARYVFVSPTHVGDRYANVGPLTRAARRVGAEVARAHGVEVAFTGYPALAVDEVEAIRDGSIVTGLVSAALVMLLFVVGFRSRGGVVVAGLPLAVGMLLAFGAIAVGVGHLNLLTQAAAPVFAGLGIDFAVHLLASYDAAGRGGESHLDAVASMMRGPAVAIVTGGLTTAGAFLALLVTEHEAFRELGLVAGLGLLWVLAAVLTLTPALLTVGAQTGSRWLQVGRGPAPEWARSDRSGFSRWVTRRPILTLASAALVTAGLAAGIPRLEFDVDVEALLPRDAESVVAARRMRAAGAISSEVLVAHAPDLEALRRMSAVMRAQPSVRRVESLASFVPDRVPEKLEILRAAPPAPLASAPLTESLPALAVAASDAAADLERVASLELAGLLREVAAAARALRDGLDPARIEAFDVALAARVEQLQSAARSARGAARGDPSTAMPPELAPRLAKDGSGFPLYIYPAEDVFAPGSLDRFLLETRAVCADVAGSPVDFARFVRQMRSSLATASCVAACVVVLLLGADLRRPWEVLLALAPVSLAIVWSLGLMGWLSVPANMANLAAIPLVLGIGVDDGLHLIHRRRSVGSSPEALRSVLGALVLTTATTVAAFGTLGLAAHRGMQSFAMVMTCGAACCLVATVVVLPNLMITALDERPARDP